MRKFLICCLSCVLTFTVFAQKDSNTSMQSFPSESAASVVKKHSPKKAALLSAIIPGTGQIYNGSWWKTPFVYAGFAGVGYGLYFLEYVLCFHLVSFFLYTAYPPGRAVNMLDLYGTIATYLIHDF